MPQWLPHPPVEDTRTAEQRMELPRTTRAEIHHYGATCNQYLPCFCWFWL